MSDVLAMNTPICPFTFSQRCKPLRTDEIMEFGIESFTLRGTIEPIYLEEMLAAVAENPDLHVASFDKNFRGKNHYIPESYFYYLCRGDRDPGILIMSAFDMPFVRPTDEEVLEANARIKELMTGPEAEAELRDIRVRFERAQIKLQDKRREIAMRKSQ